MMDSITFMFESEIISSDKIEIFEDEYKTDHQNTLYPTPEKQPFPSHQKQVLQWWAEGLVSDSEVMDNITYLFETEVLQSDKIKIITEDFTKTNSINPDDLEEADLPEIEENQEKYDLRITHFGASKFQIKPGESFYYDIVIYNNGKEDAKSSKLLLQLPSSITNTNSIIDNISQEKHQFWLEDRHTKVTLPNDCSIKLRQLICNLGEVKSDQTITMKIPVTTDAETINKHNNAQKILVSPEFIHSLPVNSKAELEWRLPDLIKGSFWAQNTAKLSYPIMNQPCDDVQYDEPRLQLDFLLGIPICFWR